LITSWSNQRNWGVTTGLSGRRYIVIPIPTHNLVIVTIFCDEILGAFGGYASATPNDEDGCPVLAQESRQNPVN
jgi:hypothetical protein